MIRLSPIATAGALAVALLASAPHHVRAAPKLPSVAPCGTVPPRMACIPGGVFTRGSDRGPSDERPVSRISISTFYIDVYEVTAAEYDQCVAAGACARQRTNYRNFSGAGQPKVGLSWFAARDYCKWKGKRLPTEAEWEKAARGPDGELYPWGNARATCKRAIIKDRPINGCGRGRTWPVGSRPAGRYGLYDMAGNSWEWVQDWYSPSYAACGKACAGPDPRGPCGGADECPRHRRRIVKGGSWYWPGSDARAARRRPHVPGNQPYHHFGFRCARDVAPTGGR